jgi:hypothetical protein
MNRRDYLFSVLSVAAVIPALRASAVQAVGTPGAIGVDETTVWTVLHRRRRICRCRRPGLERHIGACHRFRG